MLIWSHSVCDVAMWGDKDVALIGREWIHSVIIRVFRKIWMRIVNNGVIMLNNRFLGQQI